MSRSRLVVACALAFALAAARPAAADDEQVRATYHAAFEARDADALRQLWGEHPGAILVTIDADLEGSLALWEQAPDAPDVAAIAALHERALWGAGLASEVTGRSIFADYAAAFVGWDDDQKRSFREGQAAFAAARKALGEGEAAAAAEQARRCHDLALPLGDWWGAAMGLGVEGLALARGGDLAGGLAATSRARLLYEQLGLVGSELSALRTQVTLLVALERWPRAKVAVERALALARALGGDEGTLAALDEQQQAIEAALGGAAAEGDAAAGEGDGR